MDCLEVWESGYGQILQYDYVFYYARQYEPDWIQFCANMKSVIQKYQKSTKHVSSPYLPRDVVSEILGFCDAETLCLSSRVCKMWNVVANQDTHWKSIVKQKFMICTNTLKIKEEFRPKMLYGFLRRSLFGLVKGEKPIDPSCFVIPSLTLGL